MDQFNIQQLVWNVKMLVWNVHTFVEGLLAWVLRHLQLIAAAEALLPLLPPPLLPLLCCFVLLLPSIVVPLRANRGQKSLKNAPNGECLASTCTRPCTPYIAPTLKYHALPASPHGRCPPATQPQLPPARRCCAALRRASVLPPPPPPLVVS